MEIEPEIYNEIAGMIRNPDSPVGIDAERTHVYIIHTLRQIEERLARLEERES
jgi:hypothetical protein